MIWRVVSVAGGLLTLEALAAAEPVRVGIDFPLGNGAAPSTPVRVCAGRAPAVAGAAPRCDVSVVATGGEAMLELDPGNWTLSAAAEGFWSAPGDLAVGQPPDAARLTLWPAATLGGELLPAPGAVAPAVVEVQLTSSAGANALHAPPLTGSLRCPVEGARWRCSAPAVVLDLEVRPEGYVPHYAWEVALTQGQEAFLGKLDLRRAASIAGWIATVDGLAPQGPCRVEARDGPAAAPNGGSPSTAPVDKRGFFQIVGVPSGDLTLATDCAGLGRASQTVTVRPDEETRLPAPFVPLELIVVPWLDPFGRPWKIDVFALQTRKEIAVAEAVSPEGRWFRQRLGALPYEINVANAEGAYFLHQVVEPHERLGPVALRVPMLRIAGIVQIETQPIRAEITFSDEAAMLAGRVPVERMPQITVRSREDGLFETFLPASVDAYTRGWTAAVHANRPPVNQTLERVFPSERRRGGAVWFELTLAAASVRGTVVTADGRPEPRVQVHAESLESRWEYHDTTTDESGAFQFVGLPPGPYRVSVEGSAEPQDIEVVEGLEQELHFVNRSLRPFRGQVLGSGRPLADAWVHVWRPPGVLQGSCITGTDGRFEVSVPGDASELGLTIRAAGHAFRMMRWPQASGDLLQIELDTTAGRLVLSIPPEPPDESRGLVVLAHNQSLEAIEILKAWATDNGGGEDGDRLVMPAVEPGDYTLCRVPPRETASLWGGELPLEFCSRTERLDAGGTVVLKLPESTAASRR